jgi:hypothetical protein
LQLLPNIKQLLKEDPENYGKFVRMISKQKTPLLVTVHPVEVYSGFKSSVDVSDFEKRLASIKSEKKENAPSDCKVFYIRGDPRWLNILVEYDD